MIGAEQYRRDDNQGIAVIQVDLEQVTRTATEHDLLAVGHKRETEDDVNEMQPAVRVRVNADTVAGSAALMVRRIQPHK